MDSFDDNFKNTILLDLYKSPLKKRIQYDIFDLLNIRLYPSQLKSYRKQLVAEGLIKEENSDEEDSPIEITPEGYRAIQLFGTYQEYLKESKKMALSEREVLYLKERNIRLRNLNIIVGTICFIVGSISGILLSDPIKSILKQWLGGDQ